MRNLRVTMTQGELKVIGFLLEPTDQNDVTAPMNLDGVSVTIRVWRNNATVIDYAACVPNPDQTNYPGRGTFTFTEEQAGLAPGTYKLRIKAVKDGVPYFFPTLPKCGNGTLIVLAQ